jgi:hypothetical protein
LAIIARYAADDRRFGAKTDRRRRVSRPINDHNTSGGAPATIHTVEVDTTVI